MDLKQQLEQALKTSKFEFIQLSTLDDLITEDNVRKFSTKTHLSLDATKLQEITTKARRLFSILVLLDQGSAIKDCLRENFCDDSFPILNTAKIPECVDKDALYDYQ